MAAESVLYWDASALLSVLVRDSHSEDARSWLHPEHHHLISSLAHAETLAVLARIERESRASPSATARARAYLRAGPWRVLGGTPEVATTEELSLRHPLRGADLWHLAMAVSLRSTLPELKLLTYDARLAAGASKEGLYPVVSPPDE